MAFAYFAALTRWSMFGKPPHLHKERRGDDIMPGAYIKSLMAEVAAAAGAPEREIEIAPERIAGGVEVLRRFDPFFSLSPTLEELLVLEILRATTPISSGKVFSIPAFR
jgi:hypothetical protein